MNTRGKTICAVIGVMCPVLMFAGLISAGFFPPLPPSWSADQVAAFYSSHATQIRIGMVLNQFAGALMVVFASVVFVQMRRIQSEVSPVLSCVQLGSGIFTAVPFLVPTMVWLTASYRPERDPQLTWLLNDFGWIFFMGVFASTVVENVALGLAILSDRNPRPIFPRWLGYFNLWLSVLLFPAVLLSFFTTGPFAWNGALVFWVPATVFGSWFPVMLLYVLRDIRRQAAETPWRVDEGGDSVAIAGQVK